jgi:hypothetical protein
MEQKEIEKLMLEKGLTIEQVIDTVISLNAIIGVGLVSLGNHLKEYCYNKIR